MIRVRRPGPAPPILLTRGVRETVLLRHFYRANREALRRGTLVFTFKSSIYAHATVKEILSRAQHGKCAFCESNFEHVAYGDVEHYRPKAGYRQTRNGALRRPGYYWLAYAWRNLLVSCTLCNQCYKENHFPVVKGSRRSRFHGHDVTRERPLLIDPSSEDPETMIGFREHVPYAIDGNARARTTIDRLGLARSALNNRRRELFDTVATIQQLAAGHPETSQVEHAKAWLARAASPDAEYSSMVRHHVRQTPPSLLAAR